MPKHTTFPPFITQRASELRSLCERHQVKTLALFGSALREDFSAGSDLDFLVEFCPLQAVEHKRAYFGLAWALEALFDRRVDLVEVKSVRNPYLKNTIEATQETIYAAA